MNKELEELRDIFNYEKDLRIKTEKELNKQKEVLDKIKEYLWNNTNFETVYHYDKDITVGKIRAELEEILEEIE